MGAAGHERARDFTLSRRILEIEGEEGGMGCDWRSDEDEGEGRLLGRSAPPVREPPHHLTAQQREESWVVLQTPCHSRRGSWASR